VWRYLPCLWLVWCAPSALQVGSTTQPAFELDVVVHMEPGAVQIPVQPGAMAVTTPPIPESTSYSFGLALFFIGLAIAGGIIHFWWARKRKNGKN